MGPTRALLVIGDVFFTARVRDTLKHLGIVCESARSADEIARAASDAPFELAIVDLTIRSVDPITAVKQLKGLLPAVPVLSFAGHVFADLMEAARQAGSDLVVTNGRLSSELPALLREIGVTREGE